MKHTRLKKHNVEDHFRVITFDELQYKHPSLTQYIKSFKTWWHKACTGPSNTPKKDMAASRKAVRKSRSSSAIAMRSISNIFVKKYTRSKTLSMEDLKRLFLVNSVYSLNRLQSSQTFSKKRSLKTKVKNGEEYLNKWDRDIRVLYSNETNKFSHSESQYSPNPSPTDGEVPVSSSSTSGSPHKMGLIINAYHCGRDECKSIQNKKECDYRNKYCISEEVCPYHVEKISYEDRKNNASQSRDAKVLVDRACSAVAACFCHPRRKEAKDKRNKACACCFPNFPTKKLIHPKPNDIDPQKFNKMCRCGCYTGTGPKTDHTNTNMSYNFCAKSSPVRKSAEPKFHYANTHPPNNNNTRYQRKKDVLKSDYVKTQTSNEICTLCYCPIEKAPELKTDYANTQTSNDKFTCRCPKTDHVNTQTSRSTCLACGFPISSKDSPKTADSHETLPKRKKTIHKRNHSTQTFMNLFACGCSKQKEHVPEIGYSYNHSSDNMRTPRYHKERVSDQKNDHTKRLTSNNTCSCGKQAKINIKLKRHNVAEPPELTSQRDHNKLREYFRKLRRRNIEQKTIRNAAMHRLKIAHRRALASTTATDEIASAPSTSRSRRQAVLSALKHCPCCVTPIFPDPSLHFTDTYSQTPFQGTKEPHPSTSAQTSKRKSPGATPDQEKQYILYHNSLRGWLVKPLRVRQSSSLGVRLGLNKRQEDRPGHTDRSTYAQREISNKSVGNNGTSCTRNYRDCSKHSSEAMCSHWAHEKWSSGFCVRNSSRNNLSSNINEKFLPRKVHNHNLPIHECNCSLKSHENVSRKVLKPNLSKNRHKCNYSIKNNSKTPHKNTPKTNSPKNVKECTFPTKFPGYNRSKVATECIYCLYAHENNVLPNVDLRKSPRNVSVRSSSKTRHKCNCSNVKSSTSTSEHKCNWYEGKINIDPYSCNSCKHMKHKQPHLCHHVVYPCCEYPFPYCKRKNKKCMTKKVHICGKTKTCVKKVLRKCPCSKSKKKKVKKYPIGCDWLFCSTPRCVFLEWCNGCKRCCKTFILILTAVLWCPVVVLMFILHDLFFPCF